MPFADPTGWVSQQELSGLNGEPQPPQYILDAIGGSYDPARFRWDPTSFSLVDRYTGGSYNYSHIADPSLGTNVILPVGTPKAGSGGTPIDNPYGVGGQAYHYGANEAQPYFFGSPGGANEIFASGSPNEISEYEHDARTRNLQGLARVGAIVGGGAALGANGSGPVFGGGSAAAVPGGDLGAFISSGMGPQATLAGAAPLAGTSGGLGALISGGMGPQATLAGGAAAALPAAGGATNALTGAGPAAGAAGNVASNIPDWVGNYLMPGLNTLLGVHGANQASDAMAQSADRAIAEGARQFDTTRNDLMPWLDAGRTALGRLNDPNAFTASPDYNFIRGEGTRGIENSFSARGGAQSGNALRALAEFNSGLAAQDYNNWFNRQAGIAGVGQNTATQLGAFGADRAANAGNMLMNQGVARASGVLGRTNAVQNGLFDSFDNYLYRRRA